VLAVTVAMILGCSGGGATPPSNTDVSKALVAMGAGAAACSENNVPAWNGSGPYTGSMTVSGLNGGSVSVTYSSNTYPTTNPWSITGTLTFSNWYDNATGYTINGTISISASSTVALGDTTNYPQTLSVHMTWNLTLSGGPISTLTGNISESARQTSQGVYSPAPYVSGTVTANNYQFNLNSML